MFKKIVKVCLAMMMMLSLVGCGATFDHKAYVQSTLDASFKGELKEYIKLTDSTEDEAKSMYEETFKTIVDQYSMIFSASGTAMTDEQKADLEGVMKELLKALSYETADAKKVDANTYTVDVKVKPLTSIAQVEGKIMELSTDLTTKMQNGELEGIDLTNPDVNQDEVLEKYMNLLIDGVTDIFKEIVKAPEYGTEETVTVTVKLDSSKKLWNISDEDIMNVTNKLMGVK